MTSARRRHIIQAISDKARAIVPADSEIILFGSQARGDARKDSDWDILVLLNKPRVMPTDIDEVAYPLRELGWDFGETINTILYTKDEWNHDIASPFYENVTREGVRL
ncbi:MAG: nucleotidyltransferase domain-containing protein [Bacteroidaceae bacterium]|nr:nucleotidyltransferase domain-containing protein [Bacteroidaceae bacterium]MBR1801339.1 nucleotidyltransferase domain-containing protein [Bacteroidaceae bacterium]